MNEVTWWLYTFMVGMCAFAGVAFYLRVQLDKMRECEHMYKHYRICSQCGHRQVEDK